MTGAGPEKKTVQTGIWPAIVAAVALLGIVSGEAAAPKADVLQQALNYVFIGKVDPRNGVEIADRKACVIVMPDPKYRRYIRYYLGRFTLDDALFAKRYSGSRVLYQLNVKADDVVLEYLAPDKKTVTAGYRSAQIPLPGDIEPTRKALEIIFRDYCKPEEQKTPF
jgi:hypothetical protein